MDVRDHGSWASSESGHGIYTHACYPMVGGCVPPTVKRRPSQRGVISYLLVLADAGRHLKRSVRPMRYDRQCCPLCASELREIAALFIRRPNGSDVHLHASGTYHERRGAAVAAPDKRLWKK